MHSWPKPRIFRWVPIWKLSREPWVVDEPKICAKMWWFFGSPSPHHLHGLLLRFFLLPSRKDGKISKMCPGHKSGKRLFISQRSTVSQRLSSKLWDGCVLMLLTFTTENIWACSPACVHSRYDHASLSVVKTALLAFTMLVYTCSGTLLSFYIRNKKKRIYPPLTNALQDWLFDTLHISYVVTFLPRHIVDWLTVMSNSQSCHEEKRTRHTKMLIHFHESIVPWIPSNFIWSLMSATPFKSARGLITLD